jgi:uncharacterized damage-inducible protein DinB
MAAPLALELNHLIDYTDWERQKWQAWFAKIGSKPLAVSTGPNSDGRFSTAGQVIKHVFSAEKRYVDRLSNRPLADPASISDNDPEALFAFGRQSRSDFRHFLATFPADRLDISEEHKIAGHSITLTPRKIIVHVLLHEIRHWAQLATLIRLNGFPVEFHDFLFSPVLGEQRGSAVGS